MNKIWIRTLLTNGYSTFDSWMIGFQWFCESDGSTNFLEGTDFENFKSSDGHT